MTRLTVSLLGSYEVELDGQPVTAFASNKVRALLAYLATETGRRHRRQVLAGLLWPDWPERSARANLRNALSNLRKVLRNQDEPHPFLLISRDIVQFDAASDHEFDVTAFRQLTDIHQVDETTSRQLEEAITLYRGPFLQGFSVPDSAAFEDWARMVRERLERQVLAALQRLIVYYEQRGELARACEAAWRHVELAPWQERAHRTLMRLLALTGQRGAALAQYEACRRALRDELDVEPGEKTTQLYQDIRDGRLAPPSEAIQAQETTPPAAPSAPVAAAAEPPPPVQIPSSPLVGGTERGLAGERRTITALAIRIQGAAGVDVETWAEVMNRILPTLEAEIARYGGTIDRHRDDGLIALFGVPVTHEDDPERAVLAALAIQEAAQPDLADLAQQERIDLSVRAGINTGKTIATSTGDRAQVWAAPVVDLALALTEQTDPATQACAVSVARETWRLVAPLFEWDTLGEGTDQAVHRPLARAAAMRGSSIADKGRGIEGLSSPLVGRDAELRALQNAITSLRGGIGGIVTIVGEAGIGKSRLVAECRGGAACAPPVQWIEGRCLSYATGVAYSLWLDLLRGLLDLNADVPPAAAAPAVRARVHALCADRAEEVHPFLARMMSLPLTGSAEDRLRGIEDEGLQVLTFRAVETLFERAAEQSPLVVVCEDLHWADATSLALLQRLLSLTDRVPLLLICVFRPERAHGCWQIKEIAARDYAHSHTDLALEPLSRSASATLVGNLLHVEHLSQTLRERILEHAEGNPFYVEEILRSLIDGEIVVYDESSGRWQAVRDVDDIPIPGTLHGVLAARIDRLPAEPKRVLRLASVIGQFFGYPILAAIAYPPPQPPTLRGAQEGGENSDAQLIALERAQLIRQRRRVPERDYAFKHHLTQEAAYSGLLRRERRAAHRQVAKALEALQAERIEEQLGLLAHHWEQAGENERAVDYLRRAGERAAAQYANAEAAAYFSRALDLTPQESVERYALLSARERVHDLLGDREVQGRDLAALEGLAEALGDKPKQAEVAVRRARYLTTTGQFEKAVSAARAAIRLAQVAQDVHSEALGYQEWGRALRDNREAKQRHLERALALARDAGLCQVEAGVLLTLGHVLGNLTERGMACFEQALHICRQIGDRRHEGEALHRIGWALAFRGNLAEGETYQRQALDVSRETGNRVLEAEALYSLSAVSYAQGHYTRARSEAEQGLRMLREVRAWMGEGNVLWVLGPICTALGDYAAAKGYLEQSLRIYGERNFPADGAWDLVDLGLVFHVQGDYASAGDYYEQALHIGREIDSWEVEARALTYMGLLSHHLGDDSAARAYSQQALLAVPGWDIIQALEVHHAHTVLGHALTGLGRPAEAAENYRQALALHRGKGLHHLAVEPLAGLARVALAQGDLVEALAHVGEILDYMEDHPALLGTLEPLRIYLTCYRVLLANGDPRAEEIRHAAYRLLRERAATIEDEDLRRSYLENVAAHREVVALWEEASHPLNPAQRTSDL